MTSFTAAPCVCCLFPSNPEDEALKFVFRLSLLSVPNVYYGFYGTSLLLSIMKAPPKGTIK